MRDVIFRSFCPCSFGESAVNVNGAWFSGEWIEGYLFVTHKGEYTIKRYHAETNIDGVTDEVIPETVGQYTGLTDKNGKRIFEGDICRNEDGIFSVSWCAKKCAFMMTFDDYFYEQIPLEEMWDDTEVIGNIFENPELIQLQ